MTFRNVKSNNLNKRPVMEYLKKVTGGQKVTNVQESDESYRANVFKHLGNRKYEALGNHVVLKSTLLEEGYLPLADAETGVDLEVQSEVVVEEAAPANSSLFGA